MSPLISQLSGSQILNYLPPRAKNSCESTTSPLISQLSDSLQQTMHTSIAYSKEGPEGVKWDWDWPKIWVGKWI